MNPPGIDRQKLRILLYPGQQVHRPQPVGEPHLLQQPDDSKSPTLAEDDNHLWLLGLFGSQENDEQPDRNSTN